MNNIRVKHSLPHRVRLKVPAVRNSEKIARNLEKYADDIEGIYWARVNTVCAGLVIRFDESMFTENEIINLFMQQVTQRTT
ncbi:MAG: hypothetical protein BA863_16820 [Desulfovibrio sp. S3730MH75]|nr:MAG: hypothetical protein BA863_16820 [Desulfovibrio sp. S3730MH75]